MSRLLNNICGKCCIGIGLALFGLFLVPYALAEVAIASLGVYQGGSSVLTYILILALIYLIGYFIIVWKLIQKACGDNDNGHGGCN